MKIKKIFGRQVFDSRGNPTIEVDVLLDSGVLGRAIVPSGASTGIHEALELRDKDQSKFLGRPVYQAINNVNSILNRELEGYSVYNQKELDQRMINLDGTPNKRNLGANSILGVSIAIAKAAANELQLPLYRYLGGANATVLPMPMIQMIGRGIHADNTIDIQDFLVVPIGARNFSEAMEMAFKVYNATRSIFQNYKMDTSVSDEGGFWPKFKTNENALMLLMEGIEKAGYIPGKDISIAIAASYFYKNDTYNLSLEKKQFTTEQFIDFQEDLVKKYPIISLEDSCAKDDWEGWVELTKRLGNKVQLIGDDLFATNIHRIHFGVEKKVANSVLIKMNQNWNVNRNIRSN